MNLLRWFDDFIEEVIGPTPKARRSVQADGMTPGLGCWDGLDSADALAVIVRLNTGPYKEWGSSVQQCSAVGAVCRGQHFCRDFEDGTLCRGGSTFPASACRPLSGPVTPPPSSELTACIVLWLHTLQEHLTQFAWDISKK